MSERFFLASTNDGKRAEFAALLAPHGIELGASIHYREVEENADDYFGNAALKAAALRSELDRLGESATVFADDSGLEIDALDGAPGLRSARYGGLDLTWAQRRASLLAELSEVPAGRRTARFCCALLAIDGKGRRFEGFGATLGTIATVERGRAGFGYDPLFLPDGERRTFAEMSADEKARSSHRARAVRALLVAMGR